MTVTILAVSVPMSAPLLGRRGKTIATGKAAMTNGVARTGNVKETKHASATIILAKSAA